MFFLMALLSDEAFTNRLMIDSLFQPMNKDNKEKTDILVVGSDDGRFSIQ
jgi:hypothetical protein